MQRRQEGGGGFDGAAVGVKARVRFQYGLSRNGMAAKAGGAQQQRLNLFVGQKAFEILNEEVEGFRKKVAGLQKPRRLSAQRRGIFASGLYKVIEFRQNRRKELFRRIGSRPVHRDGLSDRKKKGGEDTSLGADALRFRLKSRFLNKHVIKTSGRQKHLRRRVPDVGAVDGNRRSRRNGEDFQYGAFVFNPGKKQQQEECANN